jgi:hypothetical protein
LLTALAFNWSDSILLPSLGLIAVLLVGAAVIVLIRRWRGQDDAISLSPTDLLAEYRSLYEQGVMSKEEYDSLRGILEGKTRADLKVSAAPPVGRPTGAVQSQPPAASSTPAPPDSRSQSPPPAPEAGKGPP